MPPFSNNLPPNSCLQYGVFSNHLNLRENAHVPPSNIQRCPIYSSFQHDSIFVLRSSFLQVLPPPHHTLFLRQCLSHELQEHLSAVFPDVKFSLAHNLSSIFQLEDVFYWQWYLFISLSPAIPLKLSTIIFFSPALWWLVIVLECYTTNCVVCFRCTEKKLLT